MGVELACSPSIPGAGSSITASSAIHVVGCNSISSLLWVVLGVPRRVGGWIVERTRIESLSCWSL